MEWLSAGDPAKCAGYVTVAIMCVNLMNVNAKYFPNAVRIKNEHFVISSLTDETRDANERKANYNSERQRTAAE
jgi:hypothetical protein